MSTVAEPVVQLDEARFLSRRRRGLHEVIVDAQDRLKQQQLRIQGLVNGLTDPNNEAAADQLVAERARLKSLAEALQNARAALTAFNEANPTAEELKRCEERLEREVELGKRKELQTAFATNLRQRLTLIDQLAQCEADAKTLQETAAREFPRFIGTVPSMDRYGAVQSQAGISDELVKCIPDHVFGGIHVVPGTDWRAAAEPFLRAARQWLAAIQTNSEVTEEE